MIPKIIHYCWFGGSSKPKDVRKCINSWKKYCPDFKIIEWNESNIDINMNRYTREAYEAKRWGFVPDYLRCWIVYKYGGVYLDTDVELIKPITPLLKEKAFCGIEKESNNLYVALGLGFGAEKNNPVLLSHLELYEKLRFLNLDGSVNETPSPIYTTNILKKYGFNAEDNTTQKLVDITVFSSDFFDPYDTQTTKLSLNKNTYSIHWYNASWFTDDQMIYYKHRIYIAKCERILGKKLGNICGRLSYAICHPFQRKRLKSM